MKSLFYVILTFDIPENSIEQIKEKLMQTILPTRDENGCIACDLHQDISQENLFMIYEIWTDADAWRTHMLSDLVKKFLQMTKDYNIHLTIHQLNKIV